MKRLLAAAAPLAVVAIVPAARDDHHRRCSKLFTVRMGEGAARRVYRDGHTAGRRNLRLLGYIERCQRNPRAQAFVRGFDRRQARLHAQRAYAASHPVQYAEASWFDDAGGTACGTHYTHGVASRTYSCGTQVEFFYGGRTVTATVEDWGPAAWTGRDWDLNQGSAQALGFDGVGQVGYRIVGSGR